MYRPNLSNLASSTLFLDVESTIRNLTQDYATAFNTGNYDQAATLHASNGMCMAPNQSAVEGPRPIERLLRTLGEAGQRDLRFETSRVDVSGDMAVEIGKYTMTIQNANGTTGIETGKFVHTWRRLGAWLILVNCWNSDTPAR